MIICPIVSIALKDFMLIALEFKDNERKLRKKISSSKNKVRLPTAYAVIDATLDSDPPDK